VHDDLALFVILEKQLGKLRGVKVHPQVLDVPQRSDEVVAQKPFLVAVSVHKVHSGPGRPVRVVEAVPDGPSTVHGAGEHGVATVVYLVEVAPLSTSLVPADTSTTTTTNLKLRLSSVNPKEVAEATQQVSSHSPVSLRHAK
jgi:hypothetical protein